MPSDSRYRTGRQHTLGVPARRGLGAGLRACLARVQPPRAAATTHSAPFESLAPALGAQRAVIRPRSRRAVLQAIVCGEVGGRGRAEGGLSSSAKPRHVPDALHHPLKPNRSPSLPDVLADAPASHLGLASGVIPRPGHPPPQALDHSDKYSVRYPIQKGCIEDWEGMEKFWQQCIFQYLRCDPEEHYFLMTEPPLNSPDAREEMAEIMFETFNVAGLYIAVQAVLALAAGFASRRGRQRPRRIARAG